MTTSDAQGADPPGRVMLSWAHRPDPGVTAADWRRQVLDLVVALRGFGLVTDVDLFHQQDLDVDWSRWGPRQVQECDVVLVAVNAAWRERFEGTNEPTEGAGAVAEADALLGLFSRDQQEFRRRVKLVLLPGASEQDVPARLTGVPRFTVRELTLSGLEELLRTLTGQPAHVPPPLGALPALPPATLEALERPDALEHFEVDEPAPTPEETGTTPVSASRTMRWDVAAPVSPSRTIRWAVEAPGQTAQLDDAIALLESALRRPLNPNPGQRPDRSQEDERVRLQRLMGRLEELVRRLPEAQDDAASRADRAASRRAVENRLAALVHGVRDRLEPANRCWVVLAAAVDAPAEARDVGEAEPGSRERRRRQVEQWAQRVAPIMPVDTSLAALRAPGRVVFPGDPVSADAGTTRPGQSTRWRFELCDDGSGVGAADVAGHPCQQPGTGTVGWDGRPSEMILDAEVYLPVCRDRLEAWLLTELELLADHVKSSRVDPSATLYLLARLQPPERLTLAGAHNPRPLGIRVVDEHRDLDGHPQSEFAPPGAMDLPMDADAPVTHPLATPLATLTDPAGLVRTTRRLAVELLEHVAVEDTAVLRPDGTLDAFAAAGADQQAVHQHAERLGLPVDPLSPAERRRRYEELVAEARRGLCP